MEPLRAFALPLCIHLSHPRLHRLSTAGKALGHRHGGPKENHDGIADELIDGAVVLKDGLILR